MKIKRKSVVTGHWNTMELPVTPDQIMAWQNGGLVQDIMPHLSTEEREFLITGMGLEEQRVFGGEEITE